MRSKDILKQALVRYDGTLIAVSHDREFLDGLVNKIFEFGNKKIREHLGGIYDFLDKKNIDSLADIEKKEITKAGKAIGTETASKQAFVEKKEYDREVRKMENKIGKTELRITYIEKEIIAFERIITDPSGNSESIAAPDFYSSYEKLRAEHKLLMEQWEKLCYELEQLKNKRI